jgi:hypothetical protein
VPLDNNFLDVTPIHRTHEVAKYNLRLAAMLFAENAEDHKKNQRQNQPKGYVLR